MAEITIKCVEGNPLAINVVMTAIEHSMLNGEMVTETVDFYPDTTKPVRAVLDCTTAKRQYCPQTSVSDNVVYVSDNGSIAAGVYTLTITCTDTQGKKRRYKSDPCIEVYDATSAAEIAATFDAQTYELNGVFYTFAGGGTVQADWDETDPNAPSYIQNKPDLSEYATDEELQAVEESIPDVPAWALQPQKPTYTATEVGAVPTTRTVNGKALSQDITLNAGDVGAYQKPSTGIPKSDMAAGVQSSLEKADTALQQSDLTPVENDIDAIEAKIPSAASESNQLADKNFVNSSIATNTANFVGTFNSLDELQAVQNPTNNDYGFVIETDAQGNEYYDRYKYAAASQQWLFEYKIESTPFTAAQWAAIQSGITSGDVQKLAALPTKEQMDALLDAKQDVINDLATIRSGAAKGATAYQKPSGGIPKSDLATAVQTSLNKADSALQSYTESDPVFAASPAHDITAADITAWNGKADKVEIVNHGTSDTTFTLTPNIFHVWGTVASLTLTLATASTTTMDEFIFQFTSGTTATTLSLPSTVKWVAEPEIEAGMTYQVSIVNNIAVIGGVS